jgi:hypothetical protein
MSICTVRVPVICRLVRAQKCKCTVYVHTYSSTYSSTYVRNCEAGRPILVLSLVLRTSSSCSDLASDVLESFAFCAFWYCRLFCERARTCSDLASDVLESFAPQLGPQVPRLDVGGRACRQPTTTERAATHNRPGKARVNQQCNRADCRDNTSAQMTGGYSASSPPNDSKLLLRAAVSFLRASD